MAAVVLINILDSRYRQGIHIAAIITASCLWAAIFLYGVLGTYIYYCEISGSSVFIRCGLRCRSICRDKIKEVKPSNNNTILIYYDKNNKRRCSSFRPKENFEVVIDAIRNLDSAQNL